MLLDSFGNNIGNTGIKSLRHNEILVQFFIRYQIGDGQSSGQFHILRNLRGVSLQSTTEDTRESNDIVDLIREVTAACTYDTGTCRLRLRPA